jgi:hypothetical protein
MYDTILTAYNESLSIIEIMRIVVKSAAMDTEYVLLVFHQVKILMYNQLIHMYLVFQCN